VVGGRGDWRGGGGGGTTQGSATRREIYKKGGYVRAVGGASGLGAWGYTSQGGKELHGWRWWGFCVGGGARGHGGLVGLRVVDVQCCAVLCPHQEMWATQRTVLCDGPWEVPDRLLSGTWFDIHALIPSRGGGGGTGEGLEAQGISLSPLIRPHALTQLWCDEYIPSSYRAVLCCAVLCCAPAGQVEVWRTEAGRLQGVISDLALRLSAGRVAAAGRLAAAVQVRGEDGGVCVGGGGGGCAVLCCAVLCCAVLCCAVLC
jgi:hypothetical protein